MQLEIQEITNLILSGKCVLFVGAGISKGAGLPDWSDIICKLKNQLDYNGDADWLTIAQAYEKRHDRRKLESILQMLTANERVEPGKIHNLLAKLAIDVWVTTNWDCLLEKTLNKRPYNLVINDSDLTKINPREMILIKLHGDFKNKNIIFTKNDYFLSQQTRELLWKKIILYMAERSFIFIGYGCNDPDFSAVQASLVHYLGHKHMLKSYAIATGIDDIRREDLESRNVKVIDVSLLSSDPTEALNIFLNKLLDQLQQYPCIAPEHHNADEASILVPDHVKNKFISNKWQLICCVEYCIYSSIFDSSQAFTVPSGWKPPVPLEYKHKKFRIVYYRRSDKKHENIWAGMAIGERF
jgi:hypothetical protein